MYLDDTLPKISKIAILLIVAFILNILFSSLSTPFFTSFFGISEYSQYTLNVSIATIINSIFSHLLNIIVAIWIYREAKKHNEDRWIWTAFALFFGLFAVVAFYLLLVIRELRALRTEIKEIKKDEKFNTESKNEL